MIVADASWVVAVGDSSDAHHGRAVALNREYEADRIVLHPLTLAECLVGAARLGRLEQRGTQLRSAFEISQLDVAAPGRWAQLRAVSGLRLPDVIVLDTALQHGATHVLTFDQRLGTYLAGRGIETLS